MKHPVLIASPACNLDRVYSSKFMIYELSCNVLVVVTDFKAGEEIVTVQMCEYFL